MSGQERVPPSNVQILGSQNGTSISHSNSVVDSWQDQEQTASNIKARPWTTNVCSSKPKSQEDNLISAICSWIVEHQIGLTVNMFLLHSLTHACFPRARRTTRKFFELSYYNPSSGLYALGWDDIFLVFYWVVMFTGIRASVMKYLLEPLAQKAGITKMKEKIRFSEQAWVVIYDGGFWSLGMYLMYNSEYWMNLRQLWVGWPKRELDGLMKRYYLVQFAFWIQQILVVNIEERRKDYAQMFTHHVITCALMFTSYGYHQTKVGNVILCLMDGVDVVLSLAKVLKYMKYQMACDIAFGVFMFTWFIARHVLYLLVCYSIYADIPKEIIYGCYFGSNSDLHGPIDTPDDFSHLFQPFREPQGLVCWNNSIKWTFMTALLSLQVLLMMWMWMIIKVAWKVVHGGEADDSRSDNEAEDEEVEGLNSTINKHDTGSCAGAPEIEEKVSVDSIDLSARRSSPARRFRKGAGAASGVALHSDRRELLGRIGCDKSA